MPPEPTRCLHCGAYVDPMNDEAIIRVLSEGTEVWCNEEHAAAWVVAGEKLMIDGRMSERTDG